MSRTDGLRQRRYYGAQLMLPKAYSQRKAQRMQAARQHIGILKRAVQAV